jgi:hypothetical protein
MNALFRTVLLAALICGSCGCAEQATEFAAGWNQGQANGARFREGLSRFATGYSETYNSPDAELHRMHQEQQMEAFKAQQWRDQQQRDQWFNETESNLERLRNQ